MSVTFDFALRTLQDGAATSAFGLAGGDVVLAVVGFASLFVVFGLRARAGAGEGSGACGSCDGAACGSGQCEVNAVPGLDEEAPS